MVSELITFFNPQSIAIIGASRTPSKVGSIVLKNIVDSGYSGTVYPVNPHAEMLNNLRCYPDLQSIPATPDLAVIAIPSELVLEAVSKIGEKGIKNVVILSAGFKETGTTGAQLEQDVFSMAKKFNIRILGPNCLGFVNNRIHLNATFGQTLSIRGNLRFILQSGALAASLFDWCNATKLGCSDFVTLGNKGDINENDVLDFFADTETVPPIERVGLSDVDPIGIYLESISNGPEFLKRISKISRKNPLFILKPGKSPAAMRAMQSHTGSIAGEDAVLDAVLSQSNVTRCNTLEDFFDYARAFAWENAPVGPRVGIVSNAGGVAVISADAVTKEGLELVEFDAPTKQKLSELLPRSASILNPIDVLGDALAERFAAASEILLQTNQVDALVLTITPQVMTQIEKTAELIGNLSMKYQKPIFCSFMGGSLVTIGEQKLNDYKIPCFRFPERAISALGAMWRWKKNRDLLDQAVPSTEIPAPLDLTIAKKIIEKAHTETRKSLNSLEGNDLLKSVGIQTPPTQEVTQLEQATKTAQEYGWPVVLKITSPGLLHKHDIGAVVTDISNEHEMEIAWDKIQRKITQMEDIPKDQVKIQIQKDILNGVEVIVGIKHDLTFGPVLLFGAGGTLVELLTDLNLHLLPITKDGVKTLIEASKIHTILKGYRGEPAFAIDALSTIIFNLSQVAISLPDIEEIEINPVIVTLNSAWAVDAKVILKAGEPKPVHSPQFKVATTISHVHIGEKYHEFIFETDEPFVFKPGQYISVKVAPTRINAYSIASQDEPKRFKLLVDSSPGGPGSKFFANLNPGEKISYLGPFGIFVIKPDDGAKHRIFLGTGSGCSPLRSMIESELQKNQTQVPMTLYFGLRHESDIFWKEYYEKLSKEYPNFTFKLVLSKPEQDWNGQTGHVTDLVKNDFPDGKDIAVYLCGNRGMIEEATTILQEHGCPESRIYSEKFF